MRFAVKKKSELEAQDVPCSMVFRKKAALVFPNHYSLRSSAI